MGNRIGRMSDSRGPDQDSRSPERRDQEPPETPEQRRRRLESVHTRFRSLSITVDAAIPSSMHSETSGQESELREGIHTSPSDVASSSSNPYRRDLLHQHLSDQDHEHQPQDQYPQIIKEDPYLARIERFIHDFEQNSTNRAQLWEQKLKGLVDKFNQHKELMSRLDEQTAHCYNIVKNLYNMEENINRQSTKQEQMREYTKRCDNMVRQLAGGINLYSDMEEYNGLKKEFDQYAELIKQVAKKGEKHIITVEDLANIKEQFNRFDDCIKTLYDALWKKKAILDQESEHLVSEENLLKDIDDLSLEREKRLRMHRLGNLLNINLLAVSTEKWVVFWHKCISEQDFIKMLKILKTP